MKFNSIIDIEFHMKFSTNKSIFSNQSAITNVLRKVYYFIFLT
jgi:hypothetical protein